MDRKGKEKELKIESWQIPVKNERAKQRPSVRGPTNLARDGQGPRTPALNEVGKVAQVLELGRVRRG